MPESVANMPLKSLPERIAQWLINEISEESLAPGQRVTERFVADRCGVSHGPVRDAFKLVEKLGLVRILPRRGVEVTPLDPEELEDLFEMRTALTRCVVRKVILNASDEQIHTLYDGAQKLLALMGEEDRFFSASNRLGEQLMKIAGSRKLGEFMEPIHLQIMRYRHHGFSSPAAREASASGYRDLAIALAERDEPVALDVLEYAGARLKAEVLDAFNFEFNKER